MKKFLLTLFVILFCGLNVAVFALEDNGLPTLGFAQQVGELISMAKYCGIDTTEMNQQLIQSINILAIYRKENAQNALNVFQAYAQQSPDASKINCAQVSSDFEQVEAKMPKLPNIQNVPNSQ